MKNLQHAMGHNSHTKRVQCKRLHSDVALGHDPSSSVRFYSAVFLKITTKRQLAPKSSFVSVQGGICQGGGEVGEDAFGSIKSREFVLMKEDVLEHHVSRQAPEKHPYNLRQDCQEKLSKFGKKKK